jgi:hypothetical protein
MRPNRSATTAVLLFLSFSGISTAASQIANLSLTTAMIENEAGELGTGFWIKLDGKTYLCTNKHVVARDSKVREKTKTIRVRANVLEKAVPTISLPLLLKSVTGKTFSVPLHLNDGSKRWRQHPDQNVDVFVLDMTDFRFPEVLALTAFDKSLLGTQQIILNCRITAGEDVVVIGYPVGLRQGETNMPVFRTGMIASQLGILLRGEIVDERGQKKTGNIRGFLIDGGIIQGSSGSPVILKPVSRSGTFIDGAGEGCGQFANFSGVSSGSLPFLLGIVTDTQLAPVDADHTVPSYAGLGYALDIETVIETIEQFRKGNN